eukprot:CAMPEP_0196571380 /NCGR_PEP_ID=MMETSP1081-20130531/1562_1 /TAXON_ID=36882 /ORGANISM="Pyramimonas amylifera, Strain CCMP720" /LENGTH=80 /DNA_ID=CAMNT_0041888303 /DNA_START=279 /DNA_END=521 /DNA_ORIENTATION=-
MPSAPNVFKEWQDESKAEEAAREAAFEESDFLKGMLARTEANKRIRKRDLEDKYCKRGAQYGFGDCADFKFDKNGNLVIE